MNVTLSTSTPDRIFSSADRDFLMPRPERRKSRRFPLRQSAVIRHKNTLSAEIPAFTLNASVNSVFLTTDIAIAEGRTVHVAISLKKDGVETVRLYGTGNVVRAQTLPTGRFALGIVFEKPLTSSGA